jgi:hypothetical protein
VVDKVTEDGQVSSQSLTEKEMLLDLVLFKRLMKILALSSWASQAFLMLTGSEYRTYYTPGRNFYITVNARERNLVSHTYT